MSDCQITHVRKPDRFSAHEHITHVGNLSAGWVWRREDVIRNIEQKLDTFFVMAGNKRANVAVAYPNDGRAPFLRTHADGYWNDNLLSLPPC